jgi:hypothetical protein
MVGKAGRCRDTKSVVASRFNLETYSWAGRCPVSTGLSFSS